MGGGYPSFEVLSMYSPAPADWAKKKKIRKNERKKKYGFKNVCGDWEGKKMEKRTEMREEAEEREK